MIADMGDIIVCAPTDVRSGQSRAFSMSPLRMMKISEQEGVSVYACTGTPVDCIKIAYSEICPREPDLILGGINHGSNASTNAQYSGTVGIALEGAMKGIPSIAFSLCDFDPDANFEPMRDIVRQLVSKVLREGMPRFACLNVNVPLTVPLKGVRYCRMAWGHWCKEIEKRTHPTHGYDYYWMVGYYQNDEPEEEDNDDWALAHGYIAVTPLTVDLTDHSYLELLTKQ